MVGTTAKSTFKQLNRFTKDKISQVHKKEIMFVDFYDMVLGASNATGGASSAANTSLKPLMCVTASMDGFIK